MSRKPMWCNMRNFEISGRRIGPGQPCFVLAEAGVNHNGDIERAEHLIDIAARSGADAIKFQTFLADRLATRDAPKAQYQIDQAGGAESQQEMLRRLELSPSDHERLIAYCHASGILFLSSCFDIESADLLDDLGVPAFKIPSGEITNFPYLAHVAHIGKPMIVSTGMADLPEIEEALTVIREAGDPPVMLLHCVSSYPTDPSDVNLRAMATMERHFGLPVGFSDHTIGIDISLAAASLRAAVIEKHITSDRNLPGPDHAVSLEPDELTALMIGVRRIESALGNGNKQPVASEAATAAVARKSLVAAREIPIGSTLTPDMVVIIRPGTGLAPKMLPILIGRTSICNIPAGTLLSLEMLR